LLHESWTILNKLILFTMSIWKSTPCTFHGKRHSTKNARLQLAQNDPKFQQEILPVITHLLLSILMVGLGYGSWERSLCGMNCPTSVDESVRVKGAVIMTEQYPSGRRNRLPDLLPHHPPHIPHAVSLGKCLFFSVRRYKTL